jgi:organic hydroperoxide reductase OsmC/OhrA
MKEHHYHAQLVWDGNRGDGTGTYEGYGREHHIAIAGKATLQGSSDAAFRGDASRHNPEDLFVSAIAACHMLMYLALCARSGIRVIAYADDARGTMRLNERGGGRFEDVVLQPVVTIADADNRDRALQLHERAHELCFIANSCSVPIRHDARIEVRA